MIETVILGVSEMGIKLYLSKGQRAISEEKKKQQKYCGTCSTPRNTPH